MECYDPKRQKTIDCIEDNTQVASVDFDVINSYELNAVVASHG